MQGLLKHSRCFVVLLVCVRVCFGEEGETLGERMGGCVQDPAACVIWKSLGWRTLVERSKTQVTTHPPDTRHSLPSAASSPAANQNNFRICIVYSSSSSTVHTNTVEGSGRRHLMLSFQSADILCCYCYYYFPTSIRNTVQRVPEVLLGRRHRGGQFRSPRTHIPHSYRHRRRCTGAREGSTLAPDRTNSSSRG